MAQPLLPRQRGVGHRDGGEHPVGELDHQLVLVAEVAVDRGRVGAELVADPAHGQAAEAVLVDDALGGADDHGAIEPDARVRRVPPPHTRPYPARNTVVNAVDERQPERWSSSARFAASANANSRSSQRTGQVENRAITVRDGWWISSCCPLMP